MNNETRITLTRPQINKVRHFIQAAYPNYKGFKVAVIISERPVDCTSYWDSGNRDYYAAMHILSGQVKHVPQNGTPFDNVRVPAWIPSVDQVLIQHSRVGSGPDYIRIYMHPALAPKYIEQTAAAV